jgi:hypothetical protein
VASLNLMQRNDHILEENDVLFSERNGEPWNDASQDVQELWGTIEFEGFMDEGVEAVINCLSDHLSSGDEFCIESMQNIFEIFPLSWLLWVKELQKLLDKGWGNVNFQSLDVCAVVHN